VFHTKHRAFAAGSTWEGSLAKNERELPNAAQVVVCGAGVGRCLSGLPPLQGWLQEYPPSWSKAGGYVGGCVMSKYVWFPCLLFPLHDVSGFPLSLPTLISL